jgi:hypothetical protein
MRTRCAAGAAGLLAALLTVVGCGGGKTGEVTGTVTVDGKAAPTGSSIRFVPADGDSSGAGAMIEDGRYTATKVPVGTAKVQIRVPKFAAEKAGRPGPRGPGGGQIVEGDLLPPKYNDRTELTFDVKPGNNEKDWELSSK